MCNGYRFVISPLPFPYLPFFAFDVPLSAVLPLEWRVGGSLIPRKIMWDPRMLRFGYVSSQRPVSWIFLSDRVLVSYNNELPLRRPRYTRLPLRVGVWGFPWKSFYRFRLLYVSFTAFLVKQMLVRFTWFVSRKCRFTMFVKHLKVVLAEKLKLSTAL